MNEIFHAYFSLTVKIFYHFFITFPTVFKSLQKFLSGSVYIML